MTRINSIVGLILFLSFLTSGIGAQNVSHWKIGNPYTSRCDAAFSLSPDYAALISNRSILFEPMVQGVGLESVPNVLPGNLFPREYASKPISAAMDFNDESFVLFKGNVYVPVHKGTLEPLANIASWTGWPGFWRNDIDAALRWTDGSFMFIKGLQYVSFDPNTGVTSRPNQMNRWAGWPSSWSGKIDAAFNGNDGYVYFVRNGEILAMDGNTMAFAPGYPRKLAGQKAGPQMIATNNWNSETTNSDNTFNTATATDGNINLSNWCGVGEPDAGSAPEGSNITIVRTDLAGGTGGKDFQDKLVRGTRVKEVRVWAKNKVEAIEIVTESPEGFITAGDPKGFALGSPTIFELVPGECIIGIEGTWGGSTKQSIQTLSFRTNKRMSDEYGGFGGRKGENEFSFEVPPEGSFSGFHGKSDSRSLIALGIQYYIYQYVAWGEDGKLIETSGDKSAWSTGTQEVIVEVDEEAADDGWFDDHPNARTDGTYEMMFHKTEMPNFAYFGRGVDVAKLDPMDLKSLQQFSNSPLVIIPSKTYGGPKSEWFLPHGAVQTPLNKSEKAESVEVIESYDEYLTEWGVSGGASFEFGPCSGSLSASHRDRKTSSIGKSHTMMSKKARNELLAVKFKLWWVDPMDGTNKRQRLNFAFRKAVEALPVPPGNSKSFPKISTRDMMYSGKKLPDNLRRFEDKYIDLIIKEYGTHFLNELLFGGIFGSYCVIDKQEMSNSHMTTSSISASFEAKTSGFFGVGGGAHMSADKTDSEAHQTSSLNMKIEEILIGGATTEYSDWASSVRDAPALIDYKLVPVSDLLTKEFFPNDEDIDKKRKTLELIIRNYLVGNYRKYYR